MNPGRRLCLAAVGGALLAGCASPQPQDYAQEQPVLRLEDYFNGRVLAHGLFQKRDGRVAQRFTVSMDCRWAGDQGVLDEHFTYADGSSSRRVWRLTRHADGRYTGLADDVVGVAKGQVAGNAFRWNYTLRLPVDGRTYEVQLDDWMFLIDERVLLNRASMSKFGIHLGDVLLSFHKI